jgi:hypothetical protein
MSLGEKAKEKRIADYKRELLNRRACRQTPTAYAESRFPYKYWDIQREIIEACFKHKYVTVKSCHASGKTFLAATVVLVFMEGFVPCKVMTTATTNTQIETLLWAEINTQFGKANPAYPWVWRCMNKGLKIAPDHFAVGFSSDEEINFQGLHSENFLLVADEAAGIAQPIFDALKTLMTAQNSRMLLISNPDSLTGYFYRSHEMAHFKKFTISAFETPNFEHFGITMDDIRSGDWEEKIGNEPLPFPALLAPHWVAEVYTEIGEGTPYFIAKVFGEFPTGASDKLIPLDKITAAQKRKGSTHGSNQWGFDVARKGRDTSVLRYRRGQRLEITKQFHQFDSVKLVEWAGKIIHDVDPSAPVAVDAVGLGGPIADMLRIQRKLTVFEYEGNAKSADDDCANQRSEFYWHLRKQFVTGKIAGKIDEETKEELCAIDYKIQNGKVRVLPKDMVKKEINRSPDKADGLMLCYAPIDNMTAVDDIIIPGGDKHSPKEVANEQIDFWYPAN